MCGVVAAISQRDVTHILLDGLRRLEYRGYDSAGMAIIDHQGEFHRTRVLGKVSNLEQEIARQHSPGTIGLAHTRWATHGKPLERNAHPHVADNRVVLVHNGIIENFATIKERLLAKGYSITSDTDTEIAALLIADYLKQSDSMLDALNLAIAELQGAYAMCIMDINDSSTIYGIRVGCPLLVGLGIEENFLASDVLALSRVAEDFIYLEDNDLVILQRDNIKILDTNRQVVKRPIVKKVFSPGSVDKGEYKHFMLKEIFEQPNALADTLEREFSANTTLLNKVEHIQIVACGTSYYAGMVAKLWLEQIAGIPTQVEIASEFRYRTKAISANSLLIAISQSGETLDTLMAVREAKNKYLAVLSICNVAESSLVRESDIVFITAAGPEIGVCSTKAFTTQLVALLRLAFMLPNAKSELGILKTLPRLAQEYLQLANEIQKLAHRLVHKNSVLFLGRGAHYPIALEGALKLKELSYIHAEGYPGGELKHGPLALVDEDMPVIVLLPDNALTEKLQANIQEIAARGGDLIVFAPASIDCSNLTIHETITLPFVDELIAPIVDVIPLQLLAYYVAVLKGTDVDQPRNLAKSVTVE